MIAFHSRQQTPVVVGLIAGMLPAMCALAQTAAQPVAEEIDITIPSGREYNFVVSGGFEHQFETNIDSGGEFSVSRFAAGVAMQTDINRDLRASFRLGYGLDVYDFSGGSFGLGAGVEPWDDIHTLSINAVFSYELDDTWTLFGGPIVQSQRESGADFGDSITGGGLIGMTYKWADDLTVGGGLVVISQLEDDPRISPVLVVDWKVAEELFVRSQTGGNAAARTGLELIYQPWREWEFAVGGAAQFSRFRLDDDGPVPGGVGEDFSIPIWIRATYSASQQLRIDGIAGVSLAGELELETADGNAFVKSDYDSALFAGVFASFRF